MGELTQANRPFKVATPLASDTLLLQRFAGEEGVSIPFQFTLDLLSEDEAIDPAALLRKPIVVSIVLQDESERQIHGLVQRFTQLGQRDELTFYRAEIVPWLWFLTLSTDCKVFQNKSVLDIVQEVFQGLGYTDFEVRCSRSYAPREYCVQYRETHFNFVSRLLEEEGIFYFFEHTEGKHLLVLADMNSTCAACSQDEVHMAPDEGPGHGEDLVTALTIESAVHLGKVTLRDYDFTRPSLNLETSVTGEKGEEIYAYPGRYVELSEGERYAQLLLEEGESGGKVAQGESNCRAFASGCTFTLKEHYRSDVNQKYLLLHVSHQGEAGDYRSWETAGLDYRNTFVCIPSGTPYRPQRRSRKPRIHGSQTALVVGKSGEEIFTDEYGRVKVQFYWDRLGGKDQNSSCWVRVSYPWAGKAWGGIHIPRMGQEVIVEFLEGDPDHPIITGRVYNAEQTVPYGLPANRTQSGVKSRSSLGGGTEDFNEIRMEDKKGKEQLYIHAQKDKQVVVENDRTESVGHDESIEIGHDRTESVGNDETIDIGNDRTETVGANENITIGKNRTESVGSDESISVGGNRSESVGGNESVDIGGSRSLSVGKDLSETIGAGQTVDVAKDLEETVGGKHTESVSKEFSLQAKKIQIVGKDEISLKAGKAEVVLKKNGDITIKGNKITIKGSSDVVVKGSKIAQN